MINQKYVDQVYGLAFGKCQNKEKAQRMTDSFVKIVEKQKPDDEHIERMIMVFALDNEVEL